MLIKNKKSHISCFLPDSFCPAVKESVPLRRVQTLHIIIRPQVRCGPTPRLSSRTSWKCAWNLLPGVREHTWRPSSIRNMIQVCESAREQQWVQVNYVPSCVVFIYFFPPHICLSAPRQQRFLWGRIGSNERFIGWLPQMRWDKGIRIGSDPLIRRVHCVEGLGEIQGADHHGCGS